MNNWHTETIAKFESLPVDSLKFIRWDAHRAAVIGDTIDNPKAGQYWDEYHYASMELARRGIEC